MNFALILFILVIATGIAWVANRFYFAPRRIAAGDQRVPLWVEYSASFFPVICAVFFLRSFLFEPFKIPSGSMIPTLQIGDFILVNKFTYGIRLPVINRKVVELGTPKRGDVVVFRYPRDESVDYIKRVVAIPGDVIEYQNKRLIINGEPLLYSGGAPYLDPENMRYEKEFTETYPANLGGVVHKILNDPERTTGVFQPEKFPGIEHCQYQSSGMTCKVPAGHYFAMGDNRDNSADSRFWGFVPDQNIVGRAFFVWLNLGSLSRIGRFE
ncbi:signal peptidase I [Polynucleobacter sp. IMCC30063]|uniref:signal peptidase I n=1 Tax=unclassified Polynucleobacter TaxID=2640945 RepID=UPI001F21BE1F|nr:MULTISPECIES: signal peptidase I [unclassified Polynucleobacter]MCE7506414.1 signal peptidase I [Polynucleobacter sp. IMCC30063]MCE7527686.1 signal peptidase I [Polynucleobacter sp. IMCC 30228]MCE7529504.1 signal peptidase I [Polynucleobacter sp. IMCC 29146]